MHTVHLVDMAKTCVLRGQIYNNESRLQKEHIRQTCFAVPASWKVTLCSTNDIETLKAITPKPLETFLVPNTEVASNKYRFLIF